jgi:GDPmannose 4,6-dehydratase
MVDPEYFRPAEVDLLLGDPTKARTKLNWKHERSFEDLVTDMVRADVDRQQRIVEGGMVLEDFL